MEEMLKLLEMNVVNYGINIITALLILFIGTWIARIITKSVTKVMNFRHLDHTLVKFLANLLKAALYAFVIIAAIDRAGIESTSIIAVLGAAGLAVGLALQGSLSNFAAGVMLIIFKPMKLGDTIEAAGVIGTVQEIGIFVTTLTSADNKTIFIPNSQLSSGIITNYSTQDTRRIDMQFGIGYGDDIDKARSVILDILNNDSRILQDPAPSVFVASLGDSSVNFNVRPWVNKADYWGVFADVTETIKKKFDENNISIPFPQTDIHLFNTNQN